jgi:hypothetical protein
MKKMRVYLFDELVESYDRSKLEDSFWSLIPKEIIIIIMIMIMITTPKTSIGLYAI